MSTPFDGKTWTLRKKWFSAIDSNRSLSPVANPPLIERATFCVNVKNDNDVEIVFLDNATNRIKEIWSTAENVYYDCYFHAVRGQLNFNPMNGNKTEDHFGAHFIIRYVGRSILCGANTELDIELFSDDSYISIPTAKLFQNKRSTSQTTSVTDQPMFLLAIKPNADGTLNFPPLNVGVPTPGPKDGSWHADD